VSVAKVVIDTNVFLSARDPGEPGHSASRKLLETVDDSKIRAFVSVITIAELRAGFSAAQLPALWTPFLSHLRASSAYSIEPVDESVALAAGALRSEASLHLPDALILATALQCGADCVATDDQTLLRTRTSVAVRRPADILA
jgi:predicted nucleic acid-binding protein